MPEAAAREWRRARASFDTIGAAAQASRLAALLEGRQRPPVAPVPAAAMAAGLSVREAEVLRLVARGYSNREIADELVLSVRTVERHITNIYNKLEVTGRTARAAVTAHAYRLGLLSLAD
jgi:DNA-binding NarL/FixJ family response regulator